MKVTAINKCPICGDTVNIQADVSVRLVLNEDGNSFFSTEWDDVRMQMNNAIKSYDDYECYCDDCENHALEVKELSNGLFEISAEVEESITDERWEELKTALFKKGYDAISDFLRYDYDRGESKDITENRLDQVYDNIQDGRFNIYYRYYVLNKI